MSNQELEKSLRNLKRAYAQYKRRYPKVDYQAWRQLKADYTDLQLAYNELELKLHNCVGEKVDRKVSSHEYINQYGITKQELDEWHEKNQVKESKFRKFLKLLIS